MEELKESKAIFKIYGTTRMEPTTQDDAFLISYVALCIISNAIDYAREGASIFVKLRKEEVKKTVRKLKELCDEYDRRGRLTVNKAGVCDLQQTADDFETVMRKLYSKTWRTIQLAISQKNVLSEDELNARSYCAFADLLLGLSVMVLMDNSGALINALNRRGSIAPAPIVVEMRKLLQELAGDYETPAGDVAKFRTKFFEVWKEIVDKPT